jgi:[ribosomal protein S18]-alanine N-acetyltransferase
VRLRPANIADVPAMINLERQSPPAAHWSRQQYERLFVDPRQQPSEPFVLIAPDDDESEPQPENISSPPGILAFLVARRVDTEWELENIVVAEAARRRGVGEGLLSAFIAHARGGRGNRIFLEVRGSNQAARALYLKAGFEEAGLRKSYYLSPVEDAILCRLSL